MKLKEQYKDSFIADIEVNCLYMHYITKTIRERIGGNIRKARKQNSLKQIEVAVEAGLNPSYYGKIERGLVNPSIEKLYKIIKALGIKSSEVFPF